MKIENKYLRALLFPPILLILLLVPVATALTVTVFVLGAEEELYAIPAYVLAAYTLTVVSVRAPRIFSDVKAWLHGHTYTHRFLSEYRFRSRVTIVFSLVINIVYAISNLVGWHMSQSTWLFALAIYYVLVSVMRFILAWQIQRFPEGRPLREEYTYYLSTGIFMLLLNASLSGIIIQILFHDQGTTYPGLLIFAVAAYTFYSVTIAIISNIRYRKRNSPTLSAAKALSLATALVSLLSLQTALLSSFGEGDVEFASIMNTFSGIAVTLVVIAMSVRMTVRGIRKIRAMDAEIPENEEKSEKKTDASEE